METCENWKTVSLFVCVFAMVREIRPIEPFFTSYLKSINFTSDQVFALNCIFFYIYYYFKGLTINLSSF